MLFSTRATFYLFVFFRYIFTKLRPVARKLFPEADDALLAHTEDDGERRRPLCGRGRAAIEAYCEARVSFVSFGMYSEVFCAVL